MRTKQLLIGVVGTLISVGAAFATADTAGIVMVSGRDNQICQAPLNNTTTIPAGTYTQTGGVIVGAQ